MSVLNVNTIQPVGSASTVTLSGILAVSGSTSQTSTFTGNGVQVDHSSGSSIFLGSESGTDAKFSVINNAPLQIRTNNIEKVRIGAGGSVGIGISDADITLLHLAGITSPAQGDDYATLSLGSPTQTLRKVEIGARRSTVGGDWDNIGIGFKVHESNSHTADPVLKMVLDYDGNLGVGTFNPALKLHIQDGIVATPTTPNSNCDVVIEGTTNTGIQFLSDGQTQLRFGSSGSTGDGSIIYQHSGNKLRLNTTGDTSLETAQGPGPRGERMYVTGIGSVGVGTAVPPHQFVVCHPETVSSETVNNYPGVIVSKFYANNQKANGRVYIALQPAYTIDQDLETVGLIGCQRDGAGNDSMLVFTTSTGTAYKDTLRCFGDGTVSIATSNKSIYNDTGTLSEGLAFNGGSKYTAVCRSSATPFFINRLTDDGNLVSFYQAGSNVGTISVSGNTVSYNPFLGCHIGRLSDGSKPTILEGTIVETINESIEWKSATIANVGSASSTVVIPYYGDKTSGTDEVSYYGTSYTGTVGYSTCQPKGNNKHVCIKISDTASSKAVAGVFVGWHVHDAEESGLDIAFNDITVGAVGNYFIRMKSGESVSIGDLVESNGDGTGKVQSDDIIRSKTVGKITSTNVIKTYSDGTFLVTGVLYCG